jgi:hypothetical protein
MSQNQLHNSHDPKNHHINRRQSLPAFLSFSRSIGLTRNNHPLDISSNSNMDKSETSVMAESDDVFEKSLLDIPPSPIIPPPSKKNGFKAELELLRKQTNSFRQKYENSSQSTESFKCRRYVQLTNPIIDKENEEEAEVDEFNEGFINDSDNEHSQLFNFFRKPFHRRQSLPEFSSVNQDLGGKQQQRKYSIDSMLPSLRIKKYSNVKPSANLIQAGGEHQTEKLKHYDKVVEEYKTFTAYGEPLYDQISYIPKPVKDDEVDWKKKFELLQRKYQKREVRIKEVKMLIMNNRSREEVLRCLDGILACLSNADTAKLKTTDVLQHECPLPEPSDTLNDFEMEFARLKANLAKEKNTKVCLTNIAEEYLEKFSNEEFEKRLLKNDIAENDEQIQNLRSDLEYERNEYGKEILSLKMEVEILKTTLDKEKENNAKLAAIIKSCSGDVEILSSFKSNLQSFIKSKDDKIKNLQNLLSDELAKKEYLKSVISHYLLL